MAFSFRAPGSALSRLPSSHACTACQQCWCWLLSRIRNVRCAEEDSMSKRNTRGAWSLGVLGVVVLTALPLVSEAEDTGEEQGRLLEARLPRGETRDFYPGLLSDLGYTIVAIHEPGPDVAAYEVRQGTQSSLIQLEIDPATQTAVEIAVLAPSLGTRVIERAEPSTDLALWSGAEGSLPEARAVQARAEEERAFEAS